MMARKIFLPQNFCRIVIVCVFILIKPSQASCSNLGTLPKEQLVEILNKLTEPTCKWMEICKSIYRLIHSVNPGKKMKTCLKYQMTKRCQQSSTILTCMHAYEQIGFVVNSGKYMHFKFGFFKNLRLFQAYDINNITLSSYRLGTIPPLGANPRSEIIFYISALIH